MFFAVLPFSATVTALHLLNQQGFTLRGLQ
jgi:hypothetical protein